MPGSILGTAVRRVEDPDLVTGAGTYVANQDLTGVLHAAFVRSPLAHAALTGVDTAEAEAAPGVVAVFTAATLDLPAHHGLMVVNADLPRPPLATGRVRFVGEAVAMVVAESRSAAVDATDLVDVDYDPLPAVTDLEAALAPDAPLQFPDLGSNVASGARSPDGTDALAGAEVVVRARMVNQRIAVMPLEGNAITAGPGGDGAAYDLTVTVSTQMPHGFRAQLCDLFGLDAGRVRVVAPHVGGAFGGKAGLLAEHTAVIGASRALGRPVHWADTRTENLVSMPHGRSQVGFFELGLTRAGRITGLRARVIGDCGAYAGFAGALVTGPTYIMSPGVYRIPRVAFAAAATLTNTTPVGAFRGAGRPEAAAYIERMIDIAAAELDLDPAEIRRRNFLPPEDFPLTTAVGTNYDSGDYDRSLTEALRRAGYDELRAEQAARRERGDRVQLGIGLSVYVEITAGRGGLEFGSVQVHADGTATIAAGTSGHGQGHPTAFAMLASDALGIPIEKFAFVQSDTAAVPRGGGTGGSRSLQLAGNAVRAAADEVLVLARRRAAALLEAAEDDVMLTEDGTFGVAGVPGATTLSWADVAAAAESAGAPLAVAHDFEQDGATFPFGAHVAVVEVDTDTGRVTPVRHVAVDDCGRILNPLLVTGQQHGGLAQGMAQALYEEVRYDADGNPQTGSLADYRMPSAADLPGFETANTETPSPRNPMGFKGIGESATIGSTPSIQNAVVDALRPLGVRHVDLPCTPERVWRAIRAARAGEPQDPWREPPAAFATLPVRGGAGPAEAAEAAEI